MALLLRQRWLLRLAGFRSAGEAAPEVADELAVQAVGRHTAVDRREAVSAGAGAGIASAFGEQAGQGMGGWHGMREHERRGMTWHRMAWACMSWMKVGN